MPAVPGRAVRSPVDEQNAVQMIDLVLEYDGRESRYVFPPALSALPVPVAQHDPFPAHGRVDLPGNRQASFGTPDRFARIPHDAGIGVELERLVLPVEALHGDETSRYAYLRRCDPDARVGRVDHRTKHALLQAGIQRIAEPCAAYPPASAAQPKRVAAIGRFAMAEFIFKDMVNNRGVSDQFYIASAATSTEEIWNGIGNPVYPPAKRELAKHGITCEGKRAVQLKKSDYNKYDYLIGMEERNRRNMLRILGKDPEKKVSLLLDYADEHGDIADPWYTGNFDITYRDVVRGCEGFLTYLEGKGQIIMN